MRLYTLKDAKEEIARHMSKGTSLEDSLQVLSEQGWPNNILEQINPQNYKHDHLIKDEKPKKNLNWIWALILLISIFIAGIIIYTAFEDNNEERNIAIQELLSEGGYLDGDDVLLKNSEGVLRLERNNNTARLAGNISLAFFDIRKALSTDPQSNELSKGVKICGALSEVLDNNNRGRATIVLRRVQKDPDYLSTAKWAVLAIGIDTRKMEEVDVNLLHNNNLVQACKTSSYTPDRTITRIEFSDLT